jgi:hypothetical protein
MASTEWIHRKGSPLGSQGGSTHKMSFTNFTKGHSHSFGGQYLELVPHERIRHCPVSRPYVPSNPLCAERNRRAQKKSAEIKPGNGGKRWIVRLSVQAGLKERFTSARSSWRPVLPENGTFSFFCENG